MSALGRVDPDTLARFAGEHALAGFGIALLALVVAVPLAWRLVLRYGVPRDDSRIAPKTLLVIQLAVSFAVIAGGAALFAAIADELGAEEELGRLDQTFADAIGKSVAPGVIRAFAWITHLGDPWVLTVWCVGGAAALFIARRRLLALGVVLAIAGNGLLNQTLKHIFERVRPVHDQSIATAAGWSFPSGHTSGSLVTYGIIAYVLVRTTPARWHVPIAVAATVVAFSTACSRVFLRVHFASDVLAGFASGTAWLVACIVSIEVSRMVWRRRRRPSAA
ncbi:phosphatase PAP2 family protein [Caballeronia telluris]|uniref:PAP2 superfamily protein n=1 Tax=Caballeronia telluris TaxID=326475 RepID=A0A158F035_9BURK|nr:phosphatase PAP2 family protein [Caballeronia telluris]SAL13184.1 PAP2 superfamily protein [Caballeronia telluris]